MQLKTGQVVGRCAKPFNYSGKVILSKVQYDAQIKQEIRRVKKLKHGGEWKLSNRPANTLYADDKVIEMKGPSPLI